MRRRAFTLSFIVAILCCGLGIAFPARPVYACSCAPPPDPATALADASAVFVGTVMMIDGPNNQIVSSAEPVVVTFDVARVWKGPTETPLVVITTPDGGTCGLPFRHGVEYVVYTYTPKSTNQLTTDICTRTTPSSSQQVLEDLRVLGKGAIPSVVAQAEQPPVAPSPQEAQPFQMPATLIGALVVLSILATVVVIGGVVLVARWWRR